MWVDHAVVGLCQCIGTREEGHEQQGEVGVLVRAIATIGKPGEQVGELAKDLGVQITDAAAELRPAQCGDGDLGEEDVLLLVGRHLEEEIIERPGEGAFGVEDGDLRHERLALVFHDLIDGGDQKGFLRVEIVVDEPRGDARFLCDALDRGLGEPVLHDGCAETIDDLPAPRLGKARASHKLIG